MGTRSILATLLCVFAAVAAGADEPYAPTDKEKEVLRDFDSVHDSMRDDLGKARACDSYSQYAASGKPICDMAGVCGYFEKTRSSDYVYVNAKGEKIPNVDAYSGDEAALGSCYRSALRKAHDPANDKRLKDDFDAKVLQHKKEVTDAYDAYADALAASDPKDSQTMILVAKAKKDRILEDAQKASAGQKAAPRPDLVTPDDFSKDLDEIEKRIGRTVPPKIRELYVAYLAKDAETGPVLAAASPPDLSPLTTDPYLNIPMLFSEKFAGGKEKLKANQADYGKKLDRAFDIFGKTQSSLVAVLKKRQNPANHDEIEAMITRIGSIGFRPQSLPPNAECDKPNAYYSPVSHTFTICPQMLEAPEELLRQTIAHELGHSIDPCNSTAPLLEVDGVPLSKAPAPAQPGVKPYVPAAKNPGAKDKALYIDVAGTGGAGLAKSYKSYTLKTVGAAVPRAKNPFASAIACLESPASIGAREDREADIRAALDERIGSLEKDGLTDASSSELKRLHDTRKNLHALVKEKGACSMLATRSPKSRIQESFSDWIASKVVETDLSGKPPAEAQDLAFESIAYFAAQKCRQAASLSVKNPKLDALLKKYGCAMDPPDGSVAAAVAGIDDAEGAYVNEHPDWSARIEKIFMANPAIAKSLGCSPTKGAKSCD